MLEFQEPSERLGLLALIRGGIFRAGEAATGEIHAIFKFCIIVDIP